MAVIKPSPLDHSGILTNMSPRQDSNRRSNECRAMIAWTLPSRVGGSRKATWSNGYLKSIEWGVGFEPTNDGFADRPLNRLGILTDCAPGWIQTINLQSRSLLLYSLSYWSISLPHQDSNLEQRRQKPLCCQLHYEAIIAGMENFEISTWWLTVICSASELHPKMFSDPGGTRTHDPLIKSQVHLPTELRSQSCSVNGTRTRNLRLERATSWPVTL